MVITLVEFLSNTWITDNGVDRLFTGIHIVSDPEDDNVLKDNYFYFPYKVSIKDNVITIIDNCSFLKFNISDTNPALTLGQLQSIFEQGFPSAVAFPASQLEVDTGTDFTKFVTPLTFENAAKWDLYFDETEINGLIAGLQTQINGKEPTKGSDDNYVTDAEKTLIGNTSGVNTGDQNLSGYQLKSEKDAANGYAGLDGSGKIASAQLPPIAISETFVVASQIAMLALAAQTGDVAVRTDLGKTYILQGTDPTVLVQWIELPSPTSPVTSVFGRIGAVSAQANDYTFAQLASKPTTIAGYGISDAETTTQLNTRDTNNRNRANHTGTQIAATISDFAATVRATVLTGISFASSAAVTAADSILIAIGKLQAQLGLKQDTLVSGTNIKTVNSTSLLGSGNIVVGGAVDSVNTKVGVVVLDSDDISDVGKAHKFVTAGDLTKLSNLSGTNTGDQTNISGNAATATKLLIARNINGEAFDGTNSITIYDATKVPTTTTVNSKALSSNITLTPSDIGSPAGSGNSTGTNTGDNSANTLYSGLAASKQDTLVSATNIKTINGTTLLGSGDMVISGGAGAVDSVNTKVGVVVLDTDDISDTGKAHKFVTAGDLTKLSNTSGTNSGDNASNSLYSGLISSQWDNVTGGVNYAGGNVGINKINPTERFEIVDGVIQVTNNLDNTPTVGLRFLNNGSGSSTGAKIEFPYGYITSFYAGMIIKCSASPIDVLTISSGNFSYAGNYFSFGGGSQDVTFFNSSTSGYRTIFQGPGDIAFNTYSGSFTDKVIIKQDGKLGIGTPTPSEFLEVVGNILSSGTILGSNLSGTNTGDQVGDGVTITGTGTLLDPFVAAAGSSNIDGGMSNTIYGGSIIIDGGFSI